MNTTEMLKIRKNYAFLSCNLYVNDIIDNLFTKHVIEHDDMQRIRAEVTDKDKAKRLIDILLTKQESYTTFLEELKKSHPYLYETLEKTNIDKELYFEKLYRKDFLDAVLQRRFNFSVGKLVTEDDMIQIMVFEYWKTGKGALPPDTINDLIDRMPFKTDSGNVNRIRMLQNGKPIWAYSNIELKPSADEVTVSDSFNDMNNSNETNDADDKDTLQRIHDLKTAELKLILVPCFQSEGIDGKYLEVFDKEKIDGEVFSTFNFSDIEKLFPGMPFGDKKRLEKIKESLKESHEKERNRNLKKRSTEELRTETLRVFDRIGQTSYRQDAIVRTSIVLESDLIQPVHSFRHSDDHNESILPQWIAVEAAKFAGACLTDRTNGTIHFGISHISDEDGCQEGLVVGLQINMPNFSEMYYDEIKQYFYKDQADVVFQCMRPPKLLSVLKLAKTEGGSLFVVEIDVVPIYELTHYDTFYVREKNGKGEFISGIYTFRENLPTVLQKDDLKKYMTEKSFIAQKRKEMDIFNEVNLRSRKPRYNLYQRRAKSDYYGFHL